MGHYTTTMDSCSSGMSGVSVKIYVSRILGMCASAPLLVFIFFQPIQLVELTSWLSVKELTERHTWIAILPVSEHPNALKV